MLQKYGATVSFLEEWTPLVEKLKSHSKCVLTVRDKPLEMGCAETKQVTQGAHGLSSAAELR